MVSSTMFTTRWLLLIQRRYNDGYLDVHPGVTGKIHHGSGFIGYSVDHGDISKFSPPATHPSGLGTANNSESLVPTSHWLRAGGN